MKNKIILTLGSITALVTPIVAVVSCGNKTKIIDDNVMIKDNGMLAVVSLKLNNFIDDDIKAQVALIEKSKQAFDVAVKTKKETNIQLAQTNLDNARKKLATLNMNMKAGDNLTSGQIDRAFKLFNAISKENRKNVENIEILLVGDKAAKPFIFKTNKGASNFRPDALNAIMPTKEFSGEPFLYDDKNDATLFEMNVSINEYGSVKHNLTEGQAEIFWNIYKKYCIDKDKVISIKANIQEKFYTPKQAVFNITIGTKKADFIKAAMIANLT